MSGGDSSSSDSNFKPQPTAATSKSRPKPGNGKGKGRPLRKPPLKAVPKVVAVVEENVASTSGANSSAASSVAPEEVKVEEMDLDAIVVEERPSRHASSSLSDQSSRSNSPSQSVTPPHFSIFNVEPLTTSRRSSLPKPVPIAKPPVPLRTKRRYSVHRDSDEEDEMSSSKEKDKKHASSLAFSTKRVNDSSHLSDSSSIGGNRVGQGGDLSSDSEAGSRNISKSTGRGRGRIARGTRGGKTRGRPSNVSTTAASASPVPMKRTSTAPLSAGKSIATTNGDISAASDGNNSPVVGRATRATVTLPKGYIEGVKNTRMIKAISESVRDNSSSDELSEEEEEEEEVEEVEEEVEEVVEEVQVPIEEELEEEIEEEVEEKEEELIPEVILPKKSNKSKGKEKEKPVSKEKKLFKTRDVEEEIETEEVMEITPEVIAIEVEQELVKPSEEELEAALEPESDKLGGSKRRKLDIEAQEKAAELALERIAARDLLLEQLEQEEILVKNSTHPLIDHTHNRLLEEKAIRLAQLAAFRHQHELEIDRRLEADTEATWKRWADARDTLRTDLYLANHDQLKQLIYEEKAYPFLRDHPLLINTHSLPPVPYYRAPLLHSSDPDLQPRNIIYSGHYLDPPSQNRALDHSVFELSASEIEEDLAIFGDVDEVTYPPNNTQYQSTSSLSSQLGQQPRLYSQHPRLYPPTQQQQPQHQDQHHLPSQHRQQIYSYQTPNPVSPFHPSPLQNSTTSSSSTYRAKDLGNSLATSSNTNFNGSYEGRSWHPTQAAPLIQKRNF